MNCCPILVDLFIDFLPSFLALPPASPLASDAHPIALWWQSIAHSCSFELKISEILPFFLLAYLKICLRFTSKPSGRSKNNSSSLNFDLYPVTLVQELLHVRNNNSITNIPPMFSFKFLLITAAFLVLQLNFATALPRSTNVSCAVAWEASSSFWMSEVLLPTFLHNSYFLDSTQTTERFSGERKDCGSTISQSESDNKTTLLTTTAEERDTTIKHTPDKSQNHSRTSPKKVGQGTGCLPGVWKLKWSQIKIPRGMQLDVNVDCGCQGWTSMMSMSGSSLSTTCESGPEVAEKRAHCVPCVCRNEVTIVHGFYSNFNSILIRMVRNLDFQYCANFSRPRIHPIGRESSSFRSNVCSRYAPAVPNPSSMSWWASRPKNNPPCRDHTKNSHNHPNPPPG